MGNSFDALLDVVNHHGIEVLVDISRGLCFFIFLPGQDAEKNNHSKKIIFPDVNAFVREIYKNLLVFHSISL